MMLACFLQKISQPQVLKNQLMVEDSMVSTSFLLYSKVFTAFYFQFTLTKIK